MKRILLSLILSGCFTNYAQAADDYTFTWDDYTDTVEKNVVEKTYTWTDAEGNEHTVTYKTVDTDAMEAAKTTKTIPVPSEIGSTSDYNYQFIQNVTINGTDYTFTVDYKDAENNYNYTTGGVSYVDGVYTGPDSIDLNNITGNFYQISDGHASSEYEYAGAIYNSGSGSNIGNITAGFFYDGEENRAEMNENGGAIYNGTGATINSIKNSYFIYGNASGRYGYGGAISNYGGSIGSIEESYFIGNTAGTSGGAIENSSGSSIGSIEESYFIGNTSGNDGGAISNSSGSSIGSITGSYFIGNTVSSYGGAMWNNGSIGSIEGSYFIGNTASGYYGGAIANNGGSIKSITGSYFIENTATTFSGAIYSNNSIGSIEESYFIGNTAGTNGGAIENRSSIGSADVDGSGIKYSYFIWNNAVTYGGAIYNNGGTIESMTGSYFVENTAGTSGGAIENTGSIGSIEESYFIGNTASTYGGAIANTRSIGSITGSYFIENTATSGGAIYNNYGIGSITGSYFIGNSASSNGGAIYNSDSIESITGSYFVGNTADLGGAIYNTGSICNTGSNVGIEGDFTSNTATSTSGSAYGGAIYNRGEIGVITGDFTGNSVESSSGSAYGGAIYNTGTIAGIKASKNGFTGNYATSGTSTSGQGGAIANYASAGGNSLIGATVENGTVTTDPDAFAIESDFSGNTAGEGGAICNYATGEGSIAAIGSITGSFSYNGTYDSSGNSDGGAIYNRGYNGGTVEIGDITGDFEYNCAIDTYNIADDIPTAAGGAIYNCADASTSADYTGSSTSVAIIGNITGNFTGNGAENDGARNSRGGAISNAASSAGAVATIDSITGNFRDNYALSAAYAAWGGAILNMASAESATATIGDIAAGTDENGNTAKALFSGNYATIKEAKGGMAAGGAIHNRAENGSTGAIIGNITANFEENVAGATGERNAAGGAIYNLSNDGCNAEIGTITGDFTSNKATAESGTALGGAIYNTGTITGLTGAFYSNSATTTSGSTAQGGAIYNTGAITSLTGAFTGNSAATTGGTAQGGAIYNTGSIGGTDGYTVTGLSGNTAEGATAAYGGGIYDTASSTITVEGDITGNHAAATGGSAYGGAVYLTNTGSTLTITGSAIGGSNDGDGNYASATGNAYGGAIYNVGTLNITNENGVTVSGNYATSTGGNAAGGAIYNTGTITGLTGAFSGNSATSTGGYAVGGAIFNTGTATGGYTVTGLSGNTASGTEAYGGGIYDESGSTIYVTGGVTDNHATATSVAQGGAIYNTGTLTIASGVTVSGNSASASTLNADGGAIFNAGGGKITDLNNVTFASNTAGSGGAIANAYDATIESITGSTFTGNTASDSGSSAFAYGGGAIFNYGGTIGDITGSTFTSNSASSRGGAIYNEDFSTMGSVLGSVFESNKAYDGGAIYNGDTMGSVAGSTFTGNTAENSGGAIYNEYTMGGIGSDASGTVTSFTSNTAEGGSGGAIYNGSYGRITNGITGSTFTGNAAENGIDAAYGGAIYNAGTIGGLVGVSFSGNSAASGEGEAAGGALYNAGTITGSISLGELTGNSATSSQGNAYGGAVYDEAAGSVITVTGDVTSNYASAAEGTAKGGALYTKEGDALTITGTSEKTLTISGNYVTGAKDAQGGAVYNEGTLTIDEDTVLTGNHAESTAGEAKGGAIYNVGTITGAEVLNLGAVTGNYVEGATGAYGGALYDTVTTNVNITGDVTNNYAMVTGEGNVKGGVIYLDQAEGVATAITVTGDVAGNHAETAGGYAWGGAFYNNSDGTLTITGTIGGYTDDTKTEYNGNYVTASGEAKGGAVYNEGTLNISEDGPDLIGNYAKSTGDAAYGGAIYNAETGTITGSGTLNLGNITGNYVEGATGAYGGAIYDTVTTVVHISGNVTDNHAEVTESGSVQGGVIYLKQAESNPTSITVTGDVAGNWAKTNEGTAEGGAFYNGSAGSLSIAGTIGGYTDETKTEYNGNSVSATADAKGGAIYNEGTLTISAAPDLIGNEATSTQGEAYGGAIYNEGTIYNTGSTSEGTINLGDVIGNTATGYSGAYGGAIYDTAYTGVSISGEVTDNHAIVTEKGNVEGGVIYLAKADEGETTITVSGDVSGNSAETASGYAHGGAFYNNNVGTLTIGGSLGGTYDEDTKTYSGGNYVTATGEAYGGAIYNAGTLTVGSDANPAEVTGNYATSSAGEAAGGAVYNTGILIINETGPDLIGNYAVSSAGDAAGGAIYNAGTFANAGSTGGVLNLGNITGNYAEGATSAKGGAIYDTVTTTINISGDVTGNHVKVTSAAGTSAEGSVYGGVIYLEKANAGETTITVSGNVAANYAETANGEAKGGAFYNNAAGTLSITGYVGSYTDEATGTAYDGNYVKASEDAMGGAVYNAGNLNISTTNEIKGNYAVSTEGTAAGGAIYNSGVVNGGGTLELGALTGNYAEGATGAYGGAIYDTVSTEVQINGDVTDNHAKTESGSVYGGVIYLEKAGDSATKITVKGNVTGNYAATGGGEALGGAFYNNGNATLTIEGTTGSTGENTVTISGNYVSAAGTDATTGEGYAAYGGAVYNAGTLVIGTDGAGPDLINNTATSKDGEAAGGAIYNVGNITGSGTLELGTLTGNTATGATGAYGGAIYDTVSTAVNIYGDVSKNGAEVTESGDVHGGVIYLGQAAGGAATSITVTGNVTENYAKTASGEALGGAFYNNANGTLTINAADSSTLTVSGNEAIAAGEGNTAYGGAIYNEGILNITNGVVLKGNTATSAGGEAAGGAIYTTGTVNNGAALYFGEISGNQAIGATGAKGGAIYDAVSTEIYITGEVSDNHAIVNGEGVTDANVYGGVIYLEQAENQATSITVTGVVTGNSAETSGGEAKGGAFYNNGEATLTIVKDGTSVVTGNYVKATDEAAGGAIYNAGTLNLGTDPVLTGNYAMSTAGTAMGGAIYNEGTINTLDTPSEAGLVLGALSGNQAVGAAGAKGGAIYDKVNTVITINGDVTDNHARVVSKDDTLGYEATTAVSGDVMGGVIYLEQADSGEATTITVKGNVAGNSAETENGNAYGGAFYNTDNGTLTITGNIGGYTDSTETEYNGNYVKASGEAKGGAIYNTGTLNINSGDGSGPDLIGNYAESTGGVAMGGAIYNEGTISEDGSLTFGAVTGNQAIGYSGAYGGAIYDTVSTVVNINGNVTDNHAIVNGDNAENANVYGGVIYLDQEDDDVATSITVTGEVTGNSAETSGGSAYGGAFYNKETATLTIKDAENNSIISGNYVSAAGKDSETEGGNGEAKGGAIYNAGTLNLGTEVVLTGNYAISEDGAAYGGAIYNEGIINTANSTSTDGELVLGAVTGNYAQGATGAYGGAIYDTVDAVITIKGDASDNHAIVTKEGDVEGGVIYLEKAETGATEITVTGDVKGNSATTEKGNAKGGAFYNNETGTLTIGGTIGGYTDDTKTEYNGNYVIATGTAAGGAIYNEGVLNIVSSGENKYTDIIGNSATSTEGAAYGGAIYNAGTINSDGTTDTDTKASSALVLGEVSGNTAQGATGAYGGAIYDEFNTNITINGNVSDNHAIVKSESADVTAEGSVYGGVIYLGQAEAGEATTITVNGKVSGNSAETENGSAYGGAFYNHENGTLTITGDISENYVSATGDAFGGAIYNDGLLNIGGTETDSGTTYTNITGNTATSSAGVAAGGAIYNAGTIETGSDVTETLEVGNVTGNSATGYTGAMGGAIYDTEYTAITIHGEASDNHVKVTGEDLKEKADVKGGVIYLAKADQGEATEITVTGNVEKNSAETTYGSAYGGAFYNHEQGTLTIGGDISGNYVSATEDAFGGAIYNDGLLNINSDEESGPALTGNYAVSSDGEAAGGAIYNTGSVNGDGEVLHLGAVTNNYVQGAKAAEGGAIYDAVSTEVNIYGDVSENYAAVTQEGDVKGGVIYLERATDEETAINITGSVTGNHAETKDGTAEGGAFYNHELATLTIGGDISGNWASSEAGGNAYGGAIYNEGTLNVADGITLSGNYAASSAGEAAGGALYNTGSVNGDETMNLTSVTGNYAEGATAAYGGAIYDAGTGADIAVTGDVTGNSATASSGEAAGGAIYIGSGSSITIEGDVTGNSATGTAAAKGGAIYNEGTVTLNGTVTGNTASGDDAMGGAIYNAGTVTMNIENQDAEITGNYVEKGGNKEANIVYGTKDSVTNLNIKDGSVKLSDSFEGETGYSVNIAGNGTDAATFYLYDNLLKDSNLSMADMTFNTINNSVTAYSVDKFTVAGDFDMVADVDLANESMDRIVTNGNSYGEHAGSLNVAGVNLISDTDKSRVGIYFAEPGLKENVTSSIGALPGSYQQTAYSPINEYSVTYDKNYDGSWGDDGGYFVFDRTRSNPSAMIPPLAQVGAFNAMSLMFDYAFEHSDYYMKLPSEVRLAIREKAKAARAEKLAEKNGTTFEEESAKIDEAREEEMASREGVKFYEHDNVLPLYDQNEMTRPGAWVKPFSSIESVPFKGDFKARDKYYGVLLGADTDVREGRDGWASVFTGYAGYQGIHQSYEGGVIRQDGGVLGVTESFYKKNFYTAWTAAAASTRADGRTMYGHDKTRLYTYGIASKSGWNLEYDGGKYIVLPTFMASYTYVDLRSYTSAAGLKMDADGMRAVQLNPNIKWIRNMRNGWQPYLTVGEVWTVGQRSSARADGHRLDTLRLRPYTEYGIGAQKRWANEYDGYFQVLGHAGGRRGALFTMGFRWTFN